jgi:DNA repair exonuclease SbcCD nuclease subunit
MKILFFTDAHNAEHPPRMRLPLYREEILDKQKQLLEVAKECDLTVMGGDMFHVKKPAKVPYSLTNQLMEIYREMGETIIVPGNHDFEFNVDEVRYRSPLALFNKLPNVSISNLGETEFDDMVLFSMGCGERRLYKKVKVAVLHASVTSDAHYKFDIIPMSRLQGHIFMLGHLHDFQRVDSRIISPGGLSRGVLKFDDKLDREVGCAVFEVLEGEYKALRSNFVPLDVKPAEDVFFIEKKMEENEKQAAVGKLIEFIDALAIPKTMSRDDLLEYIEGLDKLDETVKQTALRMLRGL